MYGSCASSLKAFKKVQAQALNAPSTENAAILICLPTALTLPLK
jgi:hypothetical protein